MNENIHNEDEYFKRAYHQSDEEPSPEVWSKINAALDKQDAVYYPKKFTSWRLVACLIMLLFGSAAIYYEFVKNDKEEKGIAINKSKADNKLSAPVQKSSDSINTYSLKNEKTAIINSTPLHIYENHSNSSHPDDAFKDRKQATEQMDYSSVTKQLYNIQQQKLPEFTTDVAKQFQSNNKPSPGEDLTKKTLIDKMPGDSTTSYAFAGDISDELRKQPVIGSTKEEAAAIMPDTTIAKQNYAVEKGTSYKKNTTSFKPYFTFTPFASADFTHYKLDNDAVVINGSEPEDKSDIQEREKHEFSYSAGVAAKLQLNKKLGVKTGAIYSNIAIGIQPQTLYASANGSQGVSYKYITSSGYAYVNPNSGITPMPGDSISAHIAQHHLQYLQIPALFSYTLLSKKHFSLDASVGISTNLLLSTTVEAEVDDNNREALVAIHKLQGLRPVYFSYMADANLQFFVNKHINFTLIPSFQYAIDPINKNNVVKTFPYSFGIGAGVTCRL